MLAAVRFARRSLIVDMFVHAWLPVQALHGGTSDHRERVYCRPMICLQVVMDRASAYRRRLIRMIHRFSVSLGLAL